MIVPFEIAKELKDLGYDEQVRNYYEIEFGERTFESYSSDYNTLSRYEDKRVSAPSVSSALQWIRENKGIICWVMFDYIDFTGYYGVWIEDDKQIKSTLISYDYPSAELALLESIIKYLKK